MGGVGEFAIEHLAAHVPGFTGIEVGPDVAVFATLVADDVAEDEDVALDDRQADESAHESVGGVGISIEENAGSDGVLPRLSGIVAVGVPAVDGVFFGRCPVAACVVVERAIGQFCDGSFSAVDDGEGSGGFPGATDIVAWG